MHGKTKTKHNIHGNECSSLPQFLVIVKSFQMLTIKWDKMRWDVEQQQRGSTHCCYLSHLSQPLSWCFPPLTRASCWTVWFDLIFLACQVRSVSRCFVPLSALLVNLKRDAPWQLHSFFFCSKSSNLLFLGTFFLLFPYHLCGLNSLPSIYQDATRYCFTEKKRKKRDRKYLDNKQGTTFTPPINGYYSSA